MHDKLKIITIENDRQLTDADADIRRRQAFASVDANRRSSEASRLRSEAVEDRASVKRAMRAVEARLVEALWTLARLPEPGKGQGICGLRYVHDAADRFANAVANGGRWEDATPRPALPSARAIDRMEEPLGWLALLGRDTGKLVAVAAGTKRGDVDRNVSWGRVRLALPDFGGLSVRTLQRRYEAALRSLIVSWSVTSRVNDPAWFRN